jgi:hypothetical protein
MFFDSTALVANDFKQQELIIDCAATNRSVVGMQLFFSALTLKVKLNKN